MNALYASLAALFSVFLHVGVLVVYAPEHHPVESPSAEASQAKAILAFAELDQARAQKSNAAFEALKAELAPLDSSELTTVAFGEIVLAKLEKDLRAEFENVEVEAKIDLPKLSADRPPARPDALFAPTPKPAPKPTQIATAQQITPATSAQTSAPRAPSVDLSAVKREFATDLRNSLFRALQAPRGVTRASAKVQLSYSGYQLASAQIVEPSGERAFDQAIQNAIRSARFPKLPNDLKGNEVFTIRVNIQ